MRLRKLKHWRTVEKSREALLAAFAAAGPARALTLDAGKCGDGCIVKGPRAKFTNDKDRPTEEA